MKHAAELKRVYFVYPVLHTAESQCCIAMSECVVLRQLLAHATR